MEVSNCKDINGNDVSEIKLNSDGTVLAILNVNGVNHTTNLSYDCCISNGYTFDPTNTKCYWSNSCKVGGEFKIILSPEGKNGVIFQVDNYSLNECKLEIEFDYLVKFNCEKIKNGLKDTLESIKLDLSLEKSIFDPSLPIADNLVSVISENILNISNIGTFLNGNTNTGILLEGSKCDELIQTLITKLGPIESKYIDKKSFNSDWVKYKVIIDDPKILTEIANQRIKLAVIGNNINNFSLLLDNVKLNRVCSKIIEHVKVIDNCPNFELTKFVDNKKSWVSNHIPELRNFNLKRRETKYPINDERLSINTKEVDLLINPTNVIENDIFNFITNNPCILKPFSGCTSGDTTSSCVDLEKLLTTPINEIYDAKNLLNEFIDVESRKTISAYPTIELLNYRYFNSNAHCGINSNALNTKILNKFVDSVGDFWSDLMEQVIPSTTIWGSSYLHTNDIFGIDKFKYKKSTLILCKNFNVEAPSPSVITNNNVGVLKIDVTDTNYFGPIDFIPKNIIEECSGVSIVQINSGSEFIGTIRIIGQDGDGNVTIGDTITINENITN